MRKRFLACAIPAFLLMAGCSTPSGITAKSRDIRAPDKWAVQDASTSTKAPLNNKDWLKDFEDQKLERLVDHALANNFSLKQQKALADQAKQGVTVSGAARYPELSLGLSGGRNKSLVSGYSSNFELMANVKYEVDLWGKLSATQRSARLNYGKELAAYQQASIQLIANVGRSWFNLVEAQQLMSLYQQRVKNLQSNLARIESSYRLGISQALDVYLAKNDVNSELARIAHQQQQVLEKSQAVELLLSDYPQGKLTATNSFPALSVLMPTGTPSDVITRRADVRASWYGLLAQDAQLAVAHKQRFPQFMLTASGGDASKHLSTFLNGGPLIGSLLGNIVTPLFNAGKLKALEEQARLKVVQQEQVYLAQVYKAFSEVESSINNQQRLQERHHYLLQARTNALAAESIAFNQYMSGLVTYATVLEAQRRSFDMQTAVIQASNQILQNRINLYVALGGSFHQQPMADEKMFEVLNAPKNLAETGDSKSS